MTPFLRRLLCFFMVECVLISVGARAASDPFDKMVGDLSAVVKREKVKRIAVLEFTLMNGQHAIAGRVAQERFIYDFVKRGEVVVVERDRLDPVKRELTLGLTGLLDEYTTKRIGRILGVDALVYGSLSDRKKTVWDVHAWLVAVETGEILGATTASFPHDVLGGDSLGSMAPVPIQGWRIPALSPSRVSSSSETVPVLYHNASPTDSEPEILKLTLLHEDKRSAAFNLEYFIPSGFEGKTLWITLETDVRGGGERKQAFPGKQVVRLECRTKEDAHFFSTTLRLIATLLEDDGKSTVRTLSQEWIPFQKIWINESRRDEFSSLRGPAAMKINQLTPSFVPWKKAFTLIGEFGDRPHQSKRVIIGGPEMYLELEIREWTSTKITVSSPQSKLGPVKPYRIDPEQPYFMAVTSGNEHSNLFYFQFDPASF